MMSHKCLPRKHGTQARRLRSVEGESEYCSITATVRLSCTHLVIMTRQ